ncbi:apolipoprotein N-acyltransferase [Variovorax sp. M-6]|uniref:apolipoprotein N-acyltransferase n=1 Tax=Variovorax sp. M-6 TaxID=3233041 RepID=UPI003F94F1E1
MELLLVGAAGALQSATFVHTGAWFLQLVCCGLLAWRAARAGARRAALLGAAYGSAWLWSGVWWLYIGMHHYAGLPAWMAGAAVVALGAVLSIYLAGALVLFVRCRTAVPLHDALRFGAVWSLAELARGLIFTGFPWLASGYAHVDSPLAALAPWVGVYGIGAAAATLAAWSVFSLQQPQCRWRGAAAVAVILAGLALMGNVGFTRATGALSVTLLQGNVAQNEKFAADRQRGALAWHMEALSAASTDLVIAPETAIPYLPGELPVDFWTAMEARFSAGATHAMFGMLSPGDGGVGYANSVLALAPGRARYRYDKHHLVPFGEFVPVALGWFTRLMKLPLGELSAGPVRQPAFIVRGERLAPTICYEILFGEELALRFADDADEPTLLVNVSNIAWFGESEAVQQDLQIARMRSLEFERPMLRATNTGATVVIDHHGTVRHSLPAHVRGQLEATVQGRQGLTPYAWWARRVGLWPLFAIAVVLLLVPARQRRAT